MRQGLQGHGVIEAAAEIQSPERLQSVSVGVIEDKFSQPWHQRRIVPLAQQAHGLHPLPLVAVAE